MPLPIADRLSARNDMAWAISVGGIGAIAFAALLLFTWVFATTLFLIFAGILLGVALNAMTNLLGRVVGLPHALRLTIVCLVLRYHQLAAAESQGFPGATRHRLQLFPAWQCRRGDITRLRVDYAGCGGNA